MYAFIWTLLRVIDADHSRRFNRHTGAQPMSQFIRSLCIIENEAKKITVIKVLYSSQVNPVMTQHSSTH